MMFAGAGAATLTGGALADTFAFFKTATNGQANVITDFGSGNDVVCILGYEATQSASTLVQNAIVGAAGVTLTLSDGTTITFSNLIAAAQLNGRILYG